MLLLHSFLGYGYIDADLNDVWQILRNPLSRLDFDPMTKVRSSDILGFNSTVKHCAF